MKRFFRCISFLVAAVLLLTAPAFAAEPRSSYYIVSTCVYLDQTSSNQFNVWHEVIARGLMDELGAYEIKIQESTDGEYWTTVKKITPTDEPSMVEEESLAHVGHVSYTGITGRYYRARLIMFAENSSGRGEVIVYTDTLKL